MSKIGLLFPGQGSQYVGMGKDFYDEIFESKKLMDNACDILKFDIKSMIFDGTEENLRLTEIAQPALYIVSAMYFEKFKQLGEEFEVVAGHSLGEYSALYSAGVLSFEDGLKLVRKRGIEMSKQNSKGTMYAIMGIDKSEIEKYTSETNGRTVIANINSKTQIVISGYNEETIKIAEKLASIDGVNVKQLNVSSAFHSPLMEEVKNTMESEIDNIVFKLPNAKIIPNVLGYATDDIEIIKDSLKKQVTGQVKWLDTILHMKDIGVDKLYEVGPGDVLAKLNKTIALRPKVLSI